MAHVQHSCPEGGCSVRRSTQRWAVRECLLSTQVPGRAPVLAGQSLVREGGYQRPILMLVPRHPQRTRAAGDKARSAGEPELTGRGV